MVHGIIINLKLFVLPMRIISLWFGLSARISRKTYLLSGLYLMSLKYFLDLIIFYSLGNGGILTPYQFFSPFLMSRESLLRGADEKVLWAAALLTLPFMWIGVSMSVRRALDAGRSPWTGLWFFVPFLNYALMAYLACTPSSKHQPITWQHSSHRAEQHYLWIMLKSAAFGVLLTVALTAFSVLILGEYGNALFFGAPFIIGTISSYLFNGESLKSWGATFGLVFWSLFCSSLALLLFAFEGVICLIMAFPLALLAGFMGALLGRFFAESKVSRTSHACLAILVLPILMAAENPFSKTTLVEAMTSIEINGSIDSAWPRVVGFETISASPRWLLKTGIAYPIRARIEGHGVGAVRYCEFSTGSFVEPITVWQPPDRLSFDVRSQPPPLTEWSPYRHIHPPHLNGYFVSRKGEFRLTALANNRTRLEGSTWYELNLSPHYYWRLWASSIIHLIHSRVLNHIKQVVEAEHGWSPPT